MAGFELEVFNYRLFDLESNKLPDINSDIYCGIEWCMENCLNIKKNRQILCLD